MARKAVGGVWLGCCVSRWVSVYDRSVIKSFRHKGVERFFATGSKAGIQPKHANRLNAQLTVLDTALNASEMNISGWNLHPLRGELAGFWAVTVNGNWRLTFGFEGEDAVLVDYLDYH